MEFFTFIGLFVTTYAVIGLVLVALACAIDEDFYADTVAQPSSIFYMVVFWPELIKDMFSGDNNDDDIL